VDLPRTVLAYDVLTGLTSSSGSLEDVQIAECGKAIFELLKDNAITEKEIKEGITDHKGGAVSKSLRLLYEEGKIQRKGLGKKGDPFLYNIAPENAGDSRDKYIEIPTIPTIPTINSSFKSDLNAGDENLNNTISNTHNPKAVRPCLIDSTGYCTEDEAPPRCTYDTPSKECKKFEKNCSYAPKDCKYIERA
jgi:hypothetical protein